MNTQTKYQIDGLEFTDLDIIYFESGLPGFEDLHRYVISSSSDHEPFHWLHSVDDSAIRFVVINPMVIRENYDPKISKVHLENLGHYESKDLLFYCIVTLDRNNLANSTANLVGPLVINLKENKGKQIILDDQRYGIRESVLEEGAN